MRASYTPNPFKSYRQVSARTAPPGQLVLMLFDAALNSMECALIGFKCQDFAERNQVVNKKLQHAADIIRELNACLDMNAGGQLAETLRSLYCYFDRRLTESNIKKSPDGVREVMPMIRELRDSWCTMLTQQDSGLSAATSLETNRLTGPRYSL